MFQSSAEDIFQAFTQYKFAFSLGSSSSVVLALRSSVDDFSRELQCPRVAKEWRIRILGRYTFRMRENEREKRHMARLNATKMVDRD